MSECNQFGNNHEKKYFFFFFFFALIIDVVGYSLEEEIMSSKVFLSYIFKTNLAAFRSAIIDDNTSKICRILDLDRDYLHQSIDHNGNTALILAIDFASPLTVRLLLEQGAQPDKPNEITCLTPLGIIASKVYDDYKSSKALQTLEKAKILLEHGAYVDKPSLRVFIDENDKDYYGKETPLMTAVRKGNYPLVKLLIDYKANVNTMERKTQIRAYVYLSHLILLSSFVSFSVHLAITNGDETMYDLLEKSGASISSIVTDGQNTLLHWFCYRKENDHRISLFQKLIDQGCDIDAHNQERLTPLMMAAKGDMIETCRILLINGAQIDKQDLFGHKAIDLTKIGSQCCQLLIEEGEIRRHQASPSVLSHETMIYRKRLDSIRPFTMSTNDRGRRSCEFLSTNEQDEEKDDGCLHPPIYPTEKRHSEQIDRKHDHRVLEKLLQANPKRHILKNLHLDRLRSSDHRNKSVTSLH